MQPQRIQNSHQFLVKVLTNRQVLDSRQHGCSTTGLANVQKKKEAHETAVHHCSVESSPIYFCKNFLNIYYMYKERFALSYISVTVNLEESVSIFSAPCTNQVCIHIDEITTRLL